MSSELLAREVRKALGKHNDPNLPVVVCVEKLVEKKHFSNHNCGTCAYVHVVDFLPYCRRNAWDSSSNLGLVTRDTPACPEFK